MNESVPAGVTDVPAFPPPGRPGVPLDEEHLRRLRERPLVPVALAGGHPALLVTRHADVRTVLADDRFSREAWGNGTLFARRPESLALVTSDAPTHTRRRRAVRAWFTARRAEAERPRIAALAERLLDRIEADGPPADLVARFAVPFPYEVICGMLGVPSGDVGTLLPWVSAMMSAGRYPPEEVAAAHAGMHGYFAAQVAGRRAAIAAGTPGDDLLTFLLTEPEPRRLADEEIIVFGFGLLMAGGETTSTFLASCVLELVARPELTARLRADPSLIPAAVEELLRWVWFAGTGGQPHVVLSAVELAGTRLGRGQVVVPLTDAANRDPAAFPDADAFRPDRAPNPHVGFGHGRHMCLGAPHARVELQVALAALLRRFDDLDLAVDPDRLRWRDRMFMRGVWELPVTWTPRTAAR
ncbi:cytochrome P450 [Actinomadura roseirufa]|uniref:cytochrome P450 n=1 Tax=Actinomadura roseirufa TaxID=2094049 RepID=UPI0010414F28|nr:cytochrome P450 [Actinomadura roseirufa]